MPLLAPRPAFGLNTPQKPPPEQSCIWVYPDAAGSWVYAQHTPAAVARSPGSRVYTLFEALEQIASDTGLPADYKLLFDPEANNIIPGIADRPDDAG